MRVNDAVLGAGLLVLGLAVFLYARTLPPVPGQEYGAAVFPMLVAWGLGGAGGLLVVAGTRHWQGAWVAAAWTRRPVGWGRLGAVAGLVVFYMVASEPLGFMPVSVSMLFALFMLFGARWWVAALVAAGVTVAIARGFGDLLRVPLPRGLWWF